MILFIMVANSIFIYAIQKTRKNFAMADKLFIAHSTCDILIACLRLPTNLYVSLTYKYFCVFENLTQARNVIIVDRCTWPLMRISVIISLGIALQRYLLVTKRDMNILTRRVLVAIFVVSSALTIGSMTFYMACWVVNLTIKLVM